MPGHLKRKRPSGGPGPSAAARNTAATVPAPAASRRATRQSSIPPLPVPEDPEPRRRRRRVQRAGGGRGGGDGDGPPIELSPASLSPHGKENVLVHVPKPLTRMARQNAAEAPSSARPSRSKLNLSKLTKLSSPVRTITMPPPDTPQPTTPLRFPQSAGRGRHQSNNTPLVSQSVSLGRTTPITMATSATQPTQIPKRSQTQAPSDAAKSTDGATQPDRNIDKIVLGDICFPAWYSSYYGKELLGGVPGNSAKSGNGTKASGNLATSLPYEGSKEDTNRATAHGRRDRDHPGIINMLYVCPRCFKYSRELVTWWEHVHWCEKQGYLPGNKIYAHPKGKRTIMVPSHPAPKQSRGKRGSVGQRMIQEEVHDEGEWSIREVDGGDDMLFCQNLSLFGKLFLETKSVFFDVTDFKYFLLVYTSPATPPTAANATKTEAPPKDENSRSQIVGFFSKEKMSWDNNNLACILVFPPWQRKGLGSLLMGVSYEISRREGVIGGPEKPISDLGKRGYNHFWAGEICRWLLSLTPTATSLPTSTAAPANGGATAATRGEPELVVDVEACSRATWIAPDDCLGVLREMGLAGEAGTGPPPASRATRAAGANTDAAAAAEASSSAAEPTAATDQMVRRVRISQAAVREWVAKHKVSLEKACDPDGFVEGYALKGKGKAAAEEEAV